ncbi:hypothetical protein AGR7A_pAt30076 [Agrobacterium deltaense NCPPB 1641]|uniref:Uncharacterized protein n=1 Tax=Agrobacterium deltaense NCPPB 1641 TaxID=1183425 RepID=A0A1S7UCC0_9HYPH|nr:hypothetical protein AGR7A_pAt30076 [Agrobacterium deltaense NCPPB 1641]
MQQAGNYFPKVAIYPFGNRDLSCRRAVGEALGRGHPRTSDLERRRANPRLPETGRF